MNILHLIASADPIHGGPIEGVMKTGAVWASVGVTQTIASLDPPDAPFLNDGLRQVVPLGARNKVLKLVGRLMPLRRYGYTPGAVRWLRENAPSFDVVIVNGVWNYASLAAARAFKSSNVPFVVFTHGMLDPWFSEKYPWKHMFKKLHWRFAEGILLNRAAAVCFTTEEERCRARNQFVPYAPIERVVGYGTAATPPLNESQESAVYAVVPEIRTKPHYLYLSRLHPKKGLDLLIRAFARAGTRDPNARLIIAGPDPLRMRGGLQSLAKSLGVDSRIAWLDMVTGDVKNGLLNLCEAFILPSHQENFGIAVAEALSASKPVLLSDKVNIWREVKEDCAGFVESDTVAGTERLFDRHQGLDANDRSRMRENARRCFASRFEIKNTAMQLLRDLERICSSSRGRPN